MANARSPFLYSLQCALRSYRWILHLEFYYFYCLFSAFSCKIHYTFVFNRKPREKSDSLSFHEWKETQCSSSSLKFFSAITECNVQSQSRLHERSFDASSWLFAVDYRQLHLMNNYLCYEQRPIKMLWHPVILLQKFPVNALHVWTTYCSTIFFYKNILERTQKNIWTHNLPAK